MLKVTVLPKEWIVAVTKRREQVQGDVSVKPWTELSLEVTLMCLFSSLAKDQLHDVSLPDWLFEYYTTLMEQMNKYFSLSSDYINLLL